MINRALRLLRLASLLAVAIAGTTAAAQQKTPQTVASRIEQIMQAESTAREFSGSVLVARDGRVIYQHAFGYANIEWKIPNDLQTKFEIGSITKQFPASMGLHVSSF
jgi:CubicO group peptidase (beta-lactamase class C family)